MNKLLCAAALIACPALSFAAGPNLLLDGDFESFTALVGDGGASSVTAGSNLGAWLVSGNSVDLVRNAYGSINDISIDLAGSPGPGSLSQTFNAVAGTTYTLAFDYFKNTEGTPMTVGFGGQSFTYAIATAITHTSLSWTAATSGVQTVSFASGLGNNGPTLDNVVLTGVPAAVPEPQSYALMLAGLGAMGFLARRRKSKNI